MRSLGWNQYAADARFGSVDLQTAPFEVEWPEREPQPTKFVLSTMNAASPEARHHTIFNAPELH